MKKVLQNRKFIYISLAVVILLGTVFWWTRGNDNSRGDNGQVAQDASDNPYKIDYGPPTEEEKSQANSHKDDLVKQMEDENKPPSTGKKAVTPVITKISQDAQQVTVNGFTSGVVEEGGTCTAVFTKGNNRRTATSQAFANVSTTNCPAITLSSSELTAGAWQVTLSYSSSKAEGTSPPKELTVQ